VTNATVDTSRVLETLADLKRRVGEEAARAAVRAILEGLTNVERAAMVHTWDYFARRKQIAPEGDWRSLGYLCGRGFGKTEACAQHVTDEVQAGRARFVGLAAQNEDKTIEVQVGALIRVAPPWFKPQWEVTAKTLRWPNGARALALTPREPQNIRSPNFDLSWLSECQSWPSHEWEEAYSNFLFATRIGYARMIWDATPKRRNPLLIRLLRRQASDPAKHLIVRGTMYENAFNLGAGVLADLEAEFGGTQKGREELLGEMVEDADGVLFRQAWIDGARRHEPDTLTRRVLGVDVAVTVRKGNDATGIIDAGLGVDGQVYILGDHTGKYRPEQWSKLLVDLYLANDCDCIVIETNKGHDLVPFAVRSQAQTRGLHVVVVGKNEKLPPRVPGVVRIKEVFARGEKADRAQPLATAYERGRVSHVVGANLAELEDLMTTWEPEAGKRSPDRLDACVHAVVELLGLASDRPDAKAGFKGITEAARTLAATRPSVSLTSALYRKGGGGGRI